MNKVRRQISNWGKITFSLQYKVQIALKYKMFQKIKNKKASNSIGKQSLQGNSNVSYTYEKMFNFTHNRRNTHY